LDNQGLAARRPLKLIHKVWIPSSTIIHSFTQKKKKTVGAYLNHEVTKTPNFINSR